MPCSPADPSIGELLEKITPPKPETKPAPSTTPQTTEAKPTPLPASTMAP
jgi:hypothetical protein